MVNELDEFDCRLIELLEEAGRRATSEISRAVQVSQSTVRRRIDRLLRDQVIQVVAVVQQPASLGLPVHANPFTVSHHGS